MPPTSSQRCPHSPRTLPTLPAPPPLPPPPLLQAPLRHLLRLPPLAAPCSICSQLGNDGDYQLKCDLDTDIIGEQAPHAARRNTGAGSAACTACVHCTACIQTGRCAWLGFATGRIYCRTQQGVLQASARLRMHPTPAGDDSVKCELEATGNEALTFNAVEISW